MTSDPLPLAVALLVGLFAGAAFFGGLWWTVQHLPESKYPGLLVTGSLLLRTALVLGAFFFAGNGCLDRMLACLAGFVAARFLIIRWTRGKPQKETSHAPES